MELKNYLNKLRTYSNYSRDELAKQLEISPSSIYDSETGRREPSVKILNAYSRFFGIPLDLLVNFKKTGNQESLEKYADVEYIILNQQKKLKSQNHNFVCGEIPYYSSIENYITKKDCLPRKISLPYRFKDFLRENKIWSVPYFGKEYNQAFTSDDILVVTEVDELRNGDLIIYQYRRDNHIAFGIKKYYFIDDTQQILLNTSSTDPTVQDIVISSDDFSNFFTVLGKILLSYKIFY